MAATIKIGYWRECVTPEIGTYLGGYGNGKDRQTIGKIYEDDDLFVTVIAFSDEKEETILAITLDSVRIPRSGYDEIVAEITKTTGIPDDHIVMGATHSHSAPDFVDGREYCAKWKAQVVEAAARAALGALKDRKPAKMYGGVKEVENLNFVRRYMLDGEFLGTNKKGDAHETQADRHLQVLKFVREGAEDIVLCNWGAHADHSKCFGGAVGTPEYHRGCSADYNYALRRSVEAQMGAKFAFFQAAAGNLNPISTIPSEMERIHARMEKDQVIRPIAYGRELADEVVAVLQGPMMELAGGTVKGRRSNLMANRAQGPDVGSPEYNRAVALNVIAFAQVPLETPTKESREGAEFLAKTYGLDAQGVNRAAADVNNPMHDYAVIIKVLQEGGKLEKTTEASRTAGGKLCKFYHFNSGLYSAGGLVRHSKNKDLPPLELPIHAVSCGDVAFVGAPGEIFDSCGEDVKNESPFKMTFYLEMSGASAGYFPTHLAWSHGGYEVGATNVEEGTAEAIAAEQIRLLKDMK